MVIMKTIFFFYGVSVNTKKYTACNVSAGLIQWAEM